MQTCIVSGSTAAVKSMHCMRGVANFSQMTRCRVGQSRTARYVSVSQLQLAHIEWSMCPGHVNDRTLCHWEYPKKP